MVRVIASELLQLIANDFKTVQDRRESAAVLPNSARFENSLSNSVIFWKVPRPALNAFRTNPHVLA